jgi:amidophosphoribosyltransferase
MGGIFGVVSKDDCLKTLFYGTDYHSHLGTENAGLAVCGTEGFENAIHSISQAQFKSRFFEDYKKMKGTMGIGAIDDEAPQPLVVRSRFGTFAIATTGMITNKDMLTKSLMSECSSFNEMTGGGINTTELVAKLINRGDNLVDGIKKMQDVVEGSICTLIMTPEGIYAARDKLGRFPLSIGEKNKTGEFVVATEASSFPNLGYTLKGFLGPGEITLLSLDGLKVMKPGGSKKKVCAFLWIYTGDPSSVYDGISVENTRERCGIAMAKNDDTKADFVTGIPDSGIGHAMGYAMGSAIPYRRPLVKYTSGYGRSYTPPSQDIRDLVATMKLSAIREVINNNRMIVCDDSIVRGTQLKNYTIKKLWDNGAREIHIRPACPPLMYPCIYMASTRSISELASRRAIKAIEGSDIEQIDDYLDHRSNKYQDMIRWICKDLNVTSLKYLNIEDMIEAIGLPENQLCLYCWRGR